MIIVIMGVSGSGKTVVGSQLAKKLGWNFYDADDYHPLENKEKMSQGTPLNDQDRHPWLCELHEIMMREKALGQHVVLACSALKRAYRSTLLTGSTPHWPENYQENDDLSSDTLFVHLHGSLEILSRRLLERKGHFMPRTLLDSQIDTLEPPSAPERFIAIDVDKDISVIVSEIEGEVDRKMMLVKSAQKD
ncbi:hypothetical protein XENTR_v10001808 [Xenopus tropicalis]|uniref:Probable gluconokinase n=2 Tax=Xenopus tropicalis TaxID=8364 RepID=GNTK_XENTR|nr:probable gluconokinase [Xenopus tropicalis]B0BML1.1 RecName: Full=Probable gluconokinase; AltName: Full=Gluconate kinase [Xenopus tropicalis]AAI58477.1 LOC100145063 protein [Xenopus tropicalis]KAE8633177.1 hypothetical protein XENTR_v10001808 [Xenopus tropicalis]|eukprot:NP_001120064.1 probable gluconokinase [Xenopus tropicalis]